MFILAIYLFISALALAYLEVQIEGKHGWAAQLPTWRPDGSKWYARAYQRFMGGKELTGYHMGVFGMVFLFLHYPFAAGTSWTPLSEAWTISIFLLFAVVWDYLWIIINPHYGVIKRRPQNDVTWHRHWWGPFPRDYYFGILLSLVVLMPWWSNAIGRNWLILFGTFVGGSVVTLIIIELVRGDVKR